MSIHRRKQGIMVAIHPEVTTEDRRGNPVDGPSAEPVATVRAVQLSSEGGRGPGQQDQVELTLSLPPHGDVTVGTMLRMADGTGYDVVAVRDFIKAAARQLRHLEVDLQKRPTG